MIHYILYYQILYCRLPLLKMDLEDDLKYCRSNIKQMINNSPIQGADQKKNPNQGQMSAHFSADLELLICSNFMKTTTSKLFDQELCLMAKTNDLVDSLAQSTFKDMETTTDTLNLKESASELELRSNRFERNRKLLSRRSPKNLPTQISTHMVLKEISENCSKPVFTEVKKLFSEIKILRKSPVDSQLLERKLQKKNDALLKLEQQNIQLNKKLQKNAQLIEKLNQQVSLLTSKTKNSSVESQNLQQYLEDKEKLIDQRFSKLNNIQMKVEKAILPELKEQCSKCCSMLKKLKDTIIEYRSYLSEEGKQMDILYFRYKNNIFNV